MQYVLLRDDDPCDHAVYGMISVKCFLLMALLYYHLHVDLGVHFISYRTVNGLDTAPSDT